MPKYIIERRIPSAGQMSPSDLHSIAAKSNSILSDMQTSGKQVQRIESFVLDDAIYEVRTKIDPTTGE